MPENELSGRVGLDTTDFKTAIAEMNRSIRVIESGFRASAAALGDWGKSADGLEMRIKALNGQIDLQKNKVAALEAEYKRVAAEKGATSKAAQDLEIRLNKETETLNKMEGELGQTQAALSEMGDESKTAGKGAEDLEKGEEDATGATNKLKGALDKLEGGLKSAAAGFKNLGDKVLKSVAVGLAGVAAGVTAAIAGIGAGVLKFAAASDDIVESAEKIGITAEQYQEFKYIGDQTGTSVEAIGKAFAKTTKFIGQAADGNKDALKTFKDLGVSVTDANGNLRDSQDVTFDLISALGAMENETQRDILAQQIFGKGFQELAPLINLGADGAKEMTDQIRAMGGVMSEDAVNAAADLHDKIGTLKAGVQGLGARLLSSFVPTISKVVDALMAWLANPAVQKGIQNIMDRLSSFAERIGWVLDALLDAGPFSSEFREALSTLIPEEIVDKIFDFGKTISDLINNVIIPFVTEHAEAIKGAFIAIGAALAAAGLVSLIAAIANPITLLIALVGLLGAAWAEDWGGIRTMLTEWWETVGKPIFDQLVTWLQINIPLAIQTLSNFWSNTLQPALATFWAWIQTTVFPLLQTLWDWLATNVPAAITTLSNFWTNTLRPAIEGVWSWLSTTVFPFWQSFADLLSAVVGLAVEGLAGTWENVLQPALETVYNFVKDKMQPIWTALSDFFGKIFGPVLDTFRTGPWEMFEEALDTVNQVIASIKKLFDDLTTAIKNFRLPEWMRRHSPSPFEMVFIGTNEALKRLTQIELPKLEASLKIKMPDLSGMIVGQAAGLPGRTTTINNYNTINKDLDIYVLAYQIASEIKRQG